MTTKNGFNINYLLKESSLKVKVIPVIPTTASCQKFQVKGGADYFYGSENRVGSNVGTSPGSDFTRVIFQR